jgi:hypothetical protein
MAQRCDVCGYPSGKERGKVKKVQGEVKCETCAKGAAELAEERPDEFWFDKDTGVLMSLEGAPRR